MLEVLDRVIRALQAPILEPDARAKVPVPWAILTGQTTTEYPVLTVPTGWQHVLTAVDFRMFLNNIIRGVELRSNGRTVWASGVITQDGLNNHNSDPVGITFDGGTVITAVFTTNTGGPSALDIIGEGFVQFECGKV